MGATTCSSCGASIPERYRLCGSCGTPREATRGPVEIRRFATVVNSDLKGSTALGERLDPETLREVLTLYFDEMRLVFESHGGTIEKIIGDAIVAVFGLPVRHDDDALRAVEAAAESQRALAALNDRLEQTWDVRLVVRTGIATGEVTFGEASIGQHILTGDTMVISSAMEQNAPPLEVLIAGSTYDLVRDMVDAEPVEPVTPKGGNEAHSAYRLVSVAARPQAGHAAADTAAAGLRLCPACGEENPASFRVCGMCGTELASTAAVRDTRKTVTIVFADPKPAALDGMTPSPEALRDVMTRYFEAMRVPLEAHGGTVERFIGDAVMAVFGLPVRHEDDALRAVRAAAAMQAALPVLNDQLRLTSGMEIGNHVGVNTGEVIAGDARLGQRLVTGDAVNTAARLEQAAGAGEIVLGALTYRLARDQIEAEPMAPLTLKGKAEPYAAYRLVNVAQRPSERAAATTPFVGREVEMSRLETALLEVTAAGSCQLITIIGDAGVGKSRLVREFADRASAQEQSQVLRGRCLPYGDGVTFWPIAEIVRNAAGYSDEDSRDEALGKILDIARGTSDGNDDPAEIVDRVAAAIGLSSTQFPGPELFWGIRKLLEAIANQRPLVAIVDDIHVAAPTFLELLDHLTDGVQGSPILLLTTARHELFETREEWAAGHKAEQVVLEPLSTADSEAIVAELLGGLELPVRQRITSAAEGNPLYVEQITAMLVESGAIRRDGDQWVATGRSGDIAIPPTVEALVGARLDALRDEDRQVIDPASVIGLGFAVEAVTNLVPEDAAPAVLSRLASLTTKQFVRPTVADEEYYRFGHAVIKDAAYRSLLKRTRAEIHERFAAWAEPVNRERGRELEFEEILGYHLEQAYRYRAELGAIDAMSNDLGGRAAAKLGSAGRRAFGRGDAPAASNLLRRATLVLPELEPARIELLTELAEAEIEQGQFDAAGSALDDARSAAMTINDERLDSRQALVRFQLNHITSGSIGNTADVTDAVKRMIPIFEAAGDAAGLARAWRMLWVVFGTTGALEDAADAAGRVVEIASASGDARLAARAAVAYSQAALESPMPVLEVIERSKALESAVGLDRIAEARFLAIRSVLLAMRGDFETARTMYRRSHAIMTEVGPSMTAAGASLESSRVEMLAGDAPAAVTELTRDLEILESVDERYYRSSVAGLLSHALFAIGRHDEAAHHATVAEELTGEDDVFSQITWRTARAKLLAHAGDSDRAVALAREGVAMAASGSFVEQHAESLLDLAEVLRLGGLESPEAEGQALRDALALFERKGDIVSAGRTRERLASLASAPITS